MTTYETLTNKENGHTLKIEYEGDPVNPRSDWDVVGSIVSTLHVQNEGRGPDFRVSSWEEVLEHIADNVNFEENIFNDWGEYIHERIEKYMHKYIIFLPIYKYEHGGVVLNTTGFNCRWDSGQIGIIYADKSELRQKYGKKRLSKKLVSEVEEMLAAEIQLYSDYIGG